MKTLFGQLTSKLRAKCGDRLDDMAKKLCVSPQYLCQVEHGKRAIQPRWLPLLINKYGVPEDELQYAYEMSASSVTINLIGCTELQRKLALLFAEVFPVLNTRELDEIKRLLNQGVSPH